MTQPFRLDPIGPADAYKTYALAAPISTHRRPASCVEVECDAWRHGWISLIDVSTDIGVQQANYIRLHSGRSFTASEVGTLVTFTFPSGQTCFGEHTVLLEREPIYSVRDGDWRGNPTGRTRRHVRADDWVDDFANHQQQLADRLERG